MSRFRELNDSMLQPNPVLLLSSIRLAKNMFYESHAQTYTHRLEARGKPSTWLPRGGLVEHIFLNLRTNQRTNRPTKQPANETSNEPTN